MILLLILAAANIGLTSYVWYRTLYAPIPVKAAIGKPNNPEQFVYGLRDAFDYENRKGDK